MRGLRKKELKLQRKKKDARSLVTKTTETAIMPEITETITAEIIIIKTITGIITAEIIIIKTITEIITGIMATTKITETVTEKAVRM